MSLGFLADRAIIIVFFLSAAIAEISLFNFIVPLRLLHGKVG